MCHEIRVSVHAMPEGRAACHRSQTQNRSDDCRAERLVRRDAFATEGDRRWFEFSARPQRGLCTTRSSVLSWRADDVSRIDIVLGGNDAETDTRLARHIRVRTKGNCHEIGDGLPGDEEERNG